MPQSKTRHTIRDQLVNDKRMLVNSKTRSWSKSSNDVEKHRGPGSAVSPRFFPMKPTLSRSFVLAPALWM
jgi:hypothetical protein